MAGDPPLKQVVTRSWEGGVRGTFESGWNWTAGWFRADNRDDLLFVAAPQTGYGYFKNFGKTRRQGAEFDLNGRVGRLTAGAGYTFLHATYESPETVNGESNSRGVNDILPGNRIPMIPQHMFKSYADIAATKKLTVTLGAVVVGGSYARGNENNLHRPDGRLFLGPGDTPAYGVVNLGGRYALHRRVELFAQINNLFDRRYYTAAQLGPTAFADNGTFVARPFPAVNGEFPVRHATFYAPGAPRGLWGGMRLRF
jgi:outer membrane receptor protein involved in Fe transport